MAMSTHAGGDVVEGSGLRLEGAPFDLEDIADYVEGGHHPVHIGNYLGTGEQYRIVHKLGHGGYANVWLCRDLQQDLPKFVAVKILMAGASGRDCQELRGTEYLQSTLSTDDRQHICLPLENFRIDGPNGSHLCFVYPLLGPKVKHIANTSTDPDQTIRQIAPQAVQAMATLHKGGLCHGDFTPSNVLLKSSGLEDLAEDDLISEVGPPVRNRVLTKSGDVSPGANAPQYLVYPMDVSKLHARFLTSQVAMIDFGESFATSDPPDELGTPEIYRSPELLLDNTAGVGSDLWALGCTLFEIRTGRKLFDAFDSDIDEILYSMVQIVGPLPEPWWTTWEARKSCFEDEADAQGRAIKVQRATVEKQDTAEQSTVHQSVPRNPRSIEDALGPGYWYLGKQQMEYVHRSISKAEIQVFADLLGNLLKYDPAERMSAEAILGHEWFSMHRLGEAAQIRDPGEDFWPTRS